MKSWIDIVYFSAVVFKLEFSLQDMVQKMKIRQSLSQDIAQIRMKWRNEYTYENYKLINNERYDWKLNVKAKKIWHFR